ncbi:MAG TPA: clostripain-related cysteine peptidase [Pyrinomonadaceae bacterium]
MDEIKEREWTLMFYFASDNPLAPGVVTQLKAIKEAGFHPNVNVVTQFDPQTVGTPTHIFDVNIIEKLKTHGGSNIGFCASDDPFVRDLLEDKLWRNQKTRCGDKVREKFKELLKSCHNINDYDPPLPPANRGGRAYPARGVPQEPSPKESLESFLDFCRIRYPARHYMLFILGHGVVVGNDIFLFDEHADVQSLTLKELGQVLKTFKEEIDPEGSRLELISFHSCSVSALEVAYELKGTANELKGAANYMLATQGPAFVGSWPYRQILIRVFKEGSKVNVKKLVVDIFYLCLYNSTDFLLAGYSFDLCLCNLDKVGDIKDGVQELARALIAALELRKPGSATALPLPCKPETVPDMTRALVGLLAENFILLSHWKAQSYWQESYTDLVDFCICFIRLCDEYAEKSGDPLPCELERIKAACCKVRDLLKKEELKDDPEFKCYDKIIVRNEFAGPAYQYSHGLSVYFPWSEPEADNPIWSQPKADPPFVGEYEKYDFEETCWRAFLLRYFEVTKRETRMQEDKEEYDRTQGQEQRDQTEKDICKEPGRYGLKELREDMMNLVYNDEGTLSNLNSLSKPIPSDPTGDEDCTCPSIKNYPIDTRARRERGKEAPEEKETAFPVSKTFFSESDRRDA